MALVNVCKESPYFPDKGNQLVKITIFSRRTKYTRFKHVILPSLSFWKDDFVPLHAKWTDQDLKVKFRILLVNSLIL